LETCWFVSIFFDLWY